MPCPDAALNRLAYRSALDDERELPAWVDEALRKALQINPARRYGELSEFLADLRRPSREFMTRARPPFIERNPVAFWKRVVAHPGGHRDRADLGLPGENLSRAAATPAG